MRERIDRKKRKKKHEETVKKEKKNTFGFEIRGRRKTLGDAMDPWNPSEAY